jgi:cytoplasmic iron level regulating protein YaaA (DUF328/UPF0246 family)
MKIVVSPAKSLDYKTPVPTEETSQAIFTDEALQINTLLREQSPKALSELMHISDKLAELNWKRNQSFGTGVSKDSKRAAVFAFNGDVYQGLDPYTMKPQEIQQMQERLRILSGLYGLLKPLDAIQPYRLEMGTSFKVGEAKNLYAFWKNKITNQLNDELEEGALFVNLASNEYFGAVDAKNIKVPVVSPQFKDFKNGKLKVISFYAKKARGMMVRHLIQSQASNLDDLIAFKSGGYSYSESETVDPLSPVFIR